MVTESDNSPVDPPPDEVGIRSDAQSDAAPGVDPDAVSDALDAAGLPVEVAALFDALPNVMFCVKGADDRYVAVNDAFVRRSGRADRRDVVGARAVDLFPEVLAERYEEQDQRVFDEGEPLRDELELIRRPDGRTGWYLTTKLPVVRRGTVVGLVSVSRDLETPSDEGIAMASLGRVVDMVKERLNGPVKVAQMAAAASCSEGQLERRMKRVFGLTATQYVLRARVDRAATLLVDTDRPIAEVAAECGFSDQASLTRQFGRLIGETPARFRSGRAG
jgi:PAS domain S-box-containing protein